MPRALSDPEFAQFMSDEASVVSALQPEQSKVVSWNGLSVLIYIGPNQIDTGQTTWYGTEIYAPDVYLTDVTDASQLAAIKTPGYGTTPPQSMLDTLPQSVIDTIKEEAAAAGLLINKLGERIGGFAASLTKPLVSDLTTPLIAVAVILFLVNKR